jgi:hypothetical protein
MNFYHEPETKTFRVGKCDQLPEIPPDILHLSFSRFRGNDFEISLPPNLISLTIYRSHWKNIQQTLSSLPASLQILRLENVFISSALLPPNLTFLDITEGYGQFSPKRFPPSLKSLHLIDTDIGLNFPELPLKLEEFTFINCTFCFPREELPELPELPLTIHNFWFEDYTEYEHLSEDEYPSEIKFNEDLPQKEQEKILTDFNKKHAWKKSLSRSLVRTATFKEELVAKIFHPSNVEKWFAQGDQPLVDMMLGLDDLKPLQRFYSAH